MKTQDGPPPSPTPLLLTGPIEEFDAAMRLLRIGSHVVEATPTVSLGGLRVGDRVIVKAMREPRSGHIVALEIVPVRLHGGASEAVSVPIRILSLIAGLLAELSPDHPLLDCELLPEIDRYAIRLEIAGMPERAILLPRQVLERALDDARALRIVRTVLRAAVKILRSRQLVDAVRLELVSHDAHAARFYPGTRCVRCECQLAPEDPVLVESGRRVHLACPPV